MALRIAVAGAAGRMGQEALRALGGDSAFEIVVALDRNSAGETCRSVAGPPAPELQIVSRLGEALDIAKPDVLVELTHASSAPDHTVSALRRKVAVVIGTSGLSAADLAVVREATVEYGTPCIVVPNFAIGALLMLRCAQLVAPWMPDVEVLEMHHAGKLDAPSGTAQHTAEVISAARTKSPQRMLGAVEKVAGVRGGKVKDIPVHSVRLPGLIAHQMVLFGGEGEVLTLQHDSMNRSSFMAGLKLAANEVRSLSGLVVGLDKVMFRD